MRRVSVEHFSYFVLSDTNDPVLAIEEEAMAHAWALETGAPHRVVYRRRSDNEGFKAGNVRDFCSRWGSSFELMLPLDADSLMTGETILRMVRMMQAYPKLGILQSLVTGMPTKSGFARMFQFGMRHGMRPYTMGYAWWTADCGPFWGHNALVRIKPFVDHCDLPLLSGTGPLCGHVLSHDQVEATLMRRGGYEVRVWPEECGSWEENPPTLADFSRRDVRWCQGNLQYVKLLETAGPSADEPVPARLGDAHVSGDPGLDAPDRPSALQGSWMARGRGFFPPRRRRALPDVPRPCICRLNSRVSPMCWPSLASAALWGTGCVPRGCGHWSWLFSFWLEPRRRSGSRCSCWHFRSASPRHGTGRSAMLIALSWRSAVSGLWPQLAFGAAVIGSLGGRARARLWSLPLTWAIWWPFRSLFSRPKRPWTVSRRDRDLRDPEEREDLGNRRLRALRRSGFVPALETEAA